MSNRNHRKSVQSVDKKPAAPALPDPSQQLATQLTDQYRKAISGTRDILLFGAMMMQLGGMLNQRGNNRDADANGPNAKGLGLKGWIEEHCPEINYRTAQSFYHLARGLVETFALPAKLDLSRLLSAPVDDLSKSDASLRAQLDDFIEGKSKRQLEFDFGIRSTRKTGGNIVLMLWLRDKHPELTGSVLDVSDIPEEFREDYEAFRQEYMDAHTGPQPKPLEYYQQRWAERIISIREFVLDKEEFKKLDETQLRTGYQALQDCINHIKKHCRI